MCGCRRENGFGAFGGLELPAGFQQYFRAVGLIGAQNSLSFDAGGQGTDQQGHDKHNAKGNQVSRIAHQSKIWMRKETVEDEDGKQGRNQTVTAACCRHGNG